MKDRSHKRRESTSAAMEFDVAPARKSFRGGKGRGKGRGRGRGRGRGKGLKELQVASENDEEDGVGETSAEKTAATPQERERENKNEFENVDLERLLEEVSNDHWYAASTASPLLYQWPHLKDLPLGFELESLNVELPNNLFDLDLQALEQLLGGMPAHQLMNGLKEKMIPEGKRREKRGPGERDKDESSLVLQETKKVVDIASKSYSREREETREASERIDVADVDSSGRTEEQELDDLLQISQKDKDIVEKVEEASLLASKLEDLDVDDEDAELDALLGI